MATPKIAKYNRLWLGMARGIPRPSFLEVPDFFSLLVPRGIDFVTPRFLEVLAKIPRGPRKVNFNFFTRYISNEIMATL